MSAKSIPFHLMFCNVFQLVPTMIKEIEGPKTREICHI